MSRQVCSTIAGHIIALEHPDLLGHVMTPSLALAAGEAMADLFLDHGFQLERSYLDGLDIVQSYVNPRTAEILDGFIFSIGLTQQGSGSRLCLSVRVDRDFVDGKVSSGGLTHSNGYWYIHILPQATAANVLDLVRGPGPYIERSSTFGMYAAA